MFVLRFPATSDRQFGSPPKSQRERRVGKGLLVPGLQPAGRRMTPSNVSPVVTKRQSAMSSLRASAVLAKAGIMVLRVPTRFLTSFLDLSDLADNKAQPRYVALQLCQGIWRQRHAFRGVHGCKTFGRPPPSRRQARAGWV